MRGSPAKTSSSKTATGGDAPAYGVLESAVPDRQDVEALLVFLPAFEAPGAVFGEFVDPGNGQIPYSSLSPAAMGFMRALYDHRWIVNFDWLEWQREAEAYFGDRAKLEEADLLTLRKLLTLHARKDRFAEGHLLEMLQSGHITSILRRLRDIAATMPR